MIISTFFSELSYSQRILGISATDILPVSEIDRWCCVTLCGGVLDVVWCWYPIWCIYNVIKIERMNNYLCIHGISILGANIEYFFLFKEDKRKNREKNWVYARNKALKYLVAIPCFLLGK